MTSCDMTALASVSTGMFDEDWLRLVIKMATGSGQDQSDEPCS